MIITLLEYTHDVDNYIDGITYRREEVSDPTKAQSKVVENLSTFKDKVFDWSDRGLFPQTLIEDFKLIIQIVEEMNREVLEDLKKSLLIDSIEYDDLGVDNECFLIVS